MDTLRVDICYRPLRVGFVIKSGDIAAFRQVAKISHTLWGGRFNPIINADDEEEARRLVDVFKIDLLIPIGHDDTLALPPKFPHLINPLLNDSLFTPGVNSPARAQLLDIHNALVHLRDTNKWKAIKEQKLRIYNWQENDPLADVFLTHFGTYPKAEEIGIDYLKILESEIDTTEYNLEVATPIPADFIDYPSITYLSRHDLRRQNGNSIGWDYPGFYIGDVTNFDDLISYWNLRAADIPLWFVDPNYSDRYTEIIPVWEKNVLQMVSHRSESMRKVAIWSRRENIDDIRHFFATKPLSFCRFSNDLWNGLNLRPPMMSFDRISVLGVLGRERDRPKVSFSLSNKPFSDDIWFHTQRLVASISFIGGLYGDEHHTLNPPFLPELNEFYSRTMHFIYDKLRIEPERIGLIIDAPDSDSWLYALPVAKLFDEIFDLAGYETALSNGGLITKQLISRMGGLQGARPFKIPGVRRLLRTHGPAASFTKKGAIDLIAKKDPDNPNAKFRDHLDLHIEPRASGTNLRPDEVFSHLVEKGLFRIGADLVCPSCRMSSWTALDALKQRVTCELCGNEHDATRQLVDGIWHYRRSGVLGAERNAQGAIPVALTLQQLETSFNHGLSRGAYSSSLNLTKKGEARNECEIDFVWLCRKPGTNKIAMILGECKDLGPISLEDFQRDINHLRQIAEALPKDRFETYILLSKLNLFTPDEIALARTINIEHELRVILLTDRELDPYFIYERTKKEYDIDSYGTTPEDLAKITAQIYFN